MTIDLSVKCVRNVMEQVGGHQQAVWKVTCSDCGKESIVGHSIVDKRSDAFKHFEKDGWKYYDRKSAKVFCKSCLARHAVEFPPKKGNEMSEKVAIKPSEPAREDLRLINEALHTYYEKDNYADGFTDDVLARDLNVPVAWVARERERSFGPAYSKDQLETVKFVREMIEEANKATKLAEAAEREAASAIKLAQANLERIKKHAAAKGVKIE